MKITLVTETYPPEVNGVAMTLRRLVRILVQRGHAIDVIRPKQNKTDHAIDQNPTQTTVPGLPIPGYRGLHFGLPASSRLRRLWTANRPDIVHIATEGPLGLSALRTARRLRLPVSSSFHTNFHQYSNHYGYGFLHSAAIHYFRSFHNATLRTLVPSPDTIADLDKLGFKNLGVLSRGVDGKLFNPSKRSASLREKWGLTPDQPLAIYVGRLAPEKNIGLALDAFRAMKQHRPDLRVALIGDGPLKAQLVRENPDAIHEGNQPEEDLARSYASGDIFLFPSITETFGNVVTEALASGLVVLSYDYAAAKKHIRDGISGRVAPFNNREQFIATAIDIIRSPQVWTALRQNARASVESITWDAVGELFENVLQELTRTHARANVVTVG